MGELARFDGGPDSFAMALEGALHIRQQEKIIAQVGAVGMRFLLKHVLRLIDEIALYKCEDECRAILDIVDQDVLSVETEHFTGGFMYLCVALSIGVPIFSRA